MYLLLDGLMMKEMEEEEDNTLPEVSSKKRYRYRMFILQME